MAIELRTPTDDDFDAICRADGRNFYNAYTTAETDRIRRILDLSRFRILVETGEGVRLGGGERIVGVAGSYAFDATLPGSSTLPIGGVTWVSVAATHRRQGCLRRLMEAVHEDIDERGEPLALLGASEGGIYERFGYGISTQMRSTVIDRRTASVRPEFAEGAADVRFLEGDAAHDHVAFIWDQFRRTRAGELDRDAVWHTFLNEIRAEPVDGMNPAVFLCHPDGYACFRSRAEWDGGHPKSAVEITEFAAVTPEAHAALWATLLSLDLVGPITSHAIPLDDPLPFLLDNQRALRTTELRDGIWASVRDPAICFGARTYSTTDRLVVEVGAKRWAIEGSPEEASCTAVRSKPDLITDHASFSALLLGGVRPSALARGRRLTARNDDALRRADAFFTTAVLPHCQSHI